MMVQGPLAVDSSMGQPVTITLEMLLVSIEMS